MSLAHFNYGTSFIVKFQAMYCMSSLSHGILAVLKRSTIRFPCQGRYRPDKKPLRLPSETI